jgi:hypothetical protein
VNATALIAIGVLVVLLSAFVAIRGGRRRVSAHDALGDGPSMTFAEVLAWLDERIGQRVVVGIDGMVTSPTNSGASLTGTLRPGSGEFQLIDARGGQHRDYSVGDGSFFILEGDLTSARTWVIPDDDWPETLRLELHEVQITVSVTAQPPGDSAS